MRLDEREPMERITLPGGPVPIPAKALAQLEIIRRQGLTNMLDRTTVQRLAYEAEAWALVVFLDTSPKLYAEGLFRGFRAEDEPSLEGAK